MNLFVIILQYFLFSFLLFCLRVAVLVYRNRISIIKNEFHISQTTYLIIWIIRWIVLPFTFFGLISEIVTSQNYLLNCPYHWLHSTVILFLRKETKEYFSVSNR